MIERNMTDSEILAEIKKVEDTIVSRIGGYTKKYQKAIKNKAYKHNDVLGVNDYVINGNNVICCFQKVIHTEKLADLTIANIIVTDWGAYIPMYNEYNRLSYVFLSKHSIDRMWQRMGLTLKEFFVNEYCVKSQTAHHLVKYDGYGYDDDTYVFNYGNCFFIAVADENKIVAKTCLDRDNIYTNQMMMYVESKRGGESFSNKIADKNCKKILDAGIKKTNDYLMRYCA